MYQISKLSQDSQSFIAGLSQTGKSSSAEVAFMIGREIANKLDLPSSRVDSPDQYFRVTYQIEAESLINEINEMLVIDVNVTLGYIIKFYNYRYNVAYPDRGVFAVSKDTAIEDFFKISKEFDKAILDKIKEDPIFFTGLANNLYRLLEELKV